MRWIFCLAFILFNSVGIFAQSIVNIENQFLAALDKASLNWFSYSSPYRTIQTGEITLNFKNENLDRQLSSYKIVLEIDKKIGIHAIYEVSKNSVKGKYESVNIAGKYGKFFERNEEDGSWLQVDKLSKMFGSSSLPSSREYKKIRELSETNQTTVDYKYLGNEKINHQTTNVYMTIIKRTENSGKNTTHVRKFWFAQDGKILKSDLEITIESEGGISRSQYIQTWETDENIKIQAPELSVAQ